MATQKQIEANRRNARKSSGPRSASGKKRASRNALKHGLTTPIAGAAVTREIEALARQIACDPDDRARMAARRPTAAVCSMKATPTLCTRACLRQSQREQQPCRP